MVAGKPYLPDIIKDVVARVSVITAADSTDPFSVFFEHGVKEQVSKAVNKSGNFPLAWLIMPHNERVGDQGFFARVSCDLILAMPTDSTYSQAQRDSISFKPRLLPFYELFIEELKKESRVSVSIPVKHDRIIFPYWGGGATNGTNATNLWEKFIDAVYISNLELSIYENSCIPFKNF